MNMSTSFEGPLRCPIAGPGAEESLTHSRGVRYCKSVGPNNTESVISAEGFKAFDALQGILVTPRDAQSHFLASSSNVIVENSNNFPSGFLNRVSRKIVRPRRFTTPHSMMKRGPSTGSKYST